MVTSGMNWQMTNFKENNRYCTRKDWDRNKKRMINELEVMIWN